MSPFVNSMGVCDPRSKKVCEWYGQAFTFSSQEREKILQIIKFDKEINDEVLLFDRIILDCHIYLYEHYLKLDTENPKNLKKHLLILRDKFDDLMIVLAEGATAGVVADFKINRRCDDEFRSNADPDNIGSYGRPMCHDLFMSAYPGLFPKCKFHGLDMNGFTNNPDRPEYNLPSDEYILRDNKIDDKYEGDGNTICDQFNMGISGVFGLREKAMSVGLIEEHMFYVQKSRMSDLLENLRKARISVECILDYLGESGRRGDLSLQKFVRKLSSTYNLCIPDERKKNKKKIKTSGYTTKTNKNFIVYIVELMINFMEQRGVNVGGDIRLIRNSFEKDIDPQNYYLNKARKDTDDHQLSPDSSD